VTEKEARLALVTLKAHEWWDAMEGIREELGSKFVPWLTARCKNWDVRQRVIHWMAWNDHNSDWNLFYSEIIKTHKFPDSDEFGPGETVTAESVAMGLEQMLG
jgi:hypothetical protein